VRDVSGFLLRQRGLRRKTVAGLRSALADFLGFLAAAGRAPQGLAGRLPPHRHLRHESEPHLWTAGEIRRLLAVIDRRSAVGKRDYAMILMTARLGLRISDLRQLGLGDLDWRAKTLKIVQRKTGRPLSLPLLGDVGWAVIDYVRHGRPETACTRVFVKHSYPFGAFGCSSSVASRLSRYAARGDRVPARPGARDALPARRAGRGHDRQRRADAGDISGAGTRLQRHHPGLLPALRRRTAAMLRAGRRRRHRPGRGG
jgi:integrase